MGLFKTCKFSAESSVAAVTKRRTIMMRLVRSLTTSTSNGRALADVVIGESFSCDDHVGRLERMECGWFSARAQVTNGLLELVTLTAKM